MTGEGDQVPELSACLMLTAQLPRKVHLVGSSVIPALPVAGGLLLYIYVFTAKDTLCVCP